MIVQISSLGVHVSPVFQSLRVADAKFSFKNLFLGKKRDKVIMSMDNGIYILIKAIQKCSKKGN